VRRYVQAVVNAALPFTIITKVIVFKALAFGFIARLVAEHLK
jgi:hypothetical protein